MRCSHYQKWIYLYREGELTNHQQQKLHRHLQKCEGCELLVQKVLKIESQVGTIRKSKPALSNPEGMTHNIMRATLPISQRDFKRRNWDRFICWDAFMSIKIQGATAVVAMLLLLGFIGQEAWIMNRVSQLEQRISTDSKVRIQNEEPMLKPSEIKAFISRSEFSKELDQLNEAYMSISEEWILIKKGHLSKLLRYYKKVIIQGKVDRDILNTDFTEFRKYFSDDEIDMNRLLENRETIIKHIQMM